MITKQKVRIFEHYLGYADRFDQDQSSHRAFSRSEFISIQRIVFDLQLNEKRIAVDYAYGEQINVRMKEACDNPETIQLLREVAKRMRRL